MRYELMRPHQIRQAIAENWPVVLPVGVMEYHGEHLAVGLDTLVVIRLVERLEAEAPLVILPAFHFGAASHAVAGPDGSGTVHVGAQTLVPLAREIFAGLLRVGFRNIHFFIHHQTENFAQGMPTDLAFRLGAREAIFAHLEATRGEGWWGRPEMADYYARQSEGTDPFSWIQGHPLMPPEVIARFPFDHAGIGETSLLLHLCPEGVDMTRLAEGPWFTADAARGSAALGARGAQMILEHMRRALGLGAA